MKDQLSALIDGEFEIESSEHIITSVKAGGELKGTQDAQGILSERPARVTQPPCCQIALAAERVNNLPGEWIERDRVERKIAPRRGLGIA